MLLGMVLSDALMLGMIQFDALMLGMIQFDALTPLLVGRSASMRVCWLGTILFAFPTSAVEICRFWG